MALNDIVFQKQNGGMGRKVTNEDSISGMMLGLNGAVSATTSFVTKMDTLTVGGGTIHVAKINYYEQLDADYGIVKKDASDEITSEQAAMNFIDYHVKEFFTYSTEGVLFLAVKTTGEILPAEISALQNYANGKIRQVGIGAAGASVITAQQIVGYQTEADRLDGEHKPLSIIVAQRKGALEEVSGLIGANLVNAKQQNVSLLVSQDLDATLQAEQNKNNLNEVASIGTLLGCVSAASVHESIAWVQKFPLRMTAPGFVTGDLLKETSNANLNLLNGERYIFVREHVGAADVYFNDSHTLDVATSDYAFIENVRTMDKAVRGVRANLLPYLNAPIYVDAETGELSPNTVAYIEEIAGKALDDMEKAGELSGFKVMIDPSQNVLATSELEVVIRNVPVGVMRKVRVKIGFTTSLN